MLASQHAYEFLRPRMAREVVETMVVLCLNGQSRVLQCAEVSRGGRHGCSLLPADIFRPAVLCGAAAIILAHVHPSGSPLPSPEDVELTAVVARAGDLLGIVVVDHLILPGNGVTEGHYSFADAGLL